MTSSLQLFDLEKKVFLGDTPGLSDLEMREKAGREIKAVLSKVGLYRLVFVLTLEAGRVKPDDATTIRLILNALKVKRGE